MAKKDLSKILTNGSLKQRLKLLDDQRADIVYGRGSALTDKEMDELIESFKTPEETRFYNLHLQAFRNYREIISGLETLYGKFKEAIAYITGFSLLWDSYERNEEMLNSVISEIKDKKTKDMFAKKFASKSHFLYADIEVDEEGFFRFHTDNREHKKKGKPRGEDYSLEAVLRMWKARAEEYGIDLKTGCTVLLDYSEKINYKPKAFLDKLNFLLAQIETDYALFPKYSKKQMKDEEWANLDLLNKYFVYPDPDEIEINQEQYDNYLKILKANIEDR
jgi:hypothetical protein